ncbi:MAG: trans-aconitate methyltransferase [Crocinitomicaceae bacterium]|jgi:trans-aconitate methyltransferase
MATDYYKTKKSIEEYIRLAQDVNGGKLIDKLKEFLPTNSNLLEIGTGPGTDWKILKEDFEVVGSDNSKEFLEHLQASHPTGRFLELDAITLKTEETFDAIYSNKVMHHLEENELTASIQRQSDLLNSNGIICHSFWKGEGSEIFNGMFVKYHTEVALKAFFEKDFEIQLIDTYAEFEAGDSLLLIGKKK